MSALLVSQGRHAVQDYPDLSASCTVQPQRHLNPDAQSGRSGSNSNDKAT
ncbi:hypothetical protein AVEN_75334-1, partial [Araneus ventricosus]